VILRTEVSLEEKVMGTFKFVPVVVWADAEKTIVPPSTREVLTVGVRLMRPANRGGPALVPPPHAERLHRERIATAKARLLKCNLPMHPSSHLP
jgi:hypothetical protein